MRIKGHSFHKSLKMEINCNAKTTCRMLLLFFFFILMLCVDPSFQQEPQNEAPEKPTFSMFIQQTVSVWKKSHQTSLDKLKNLIHQMQLQFFPPNLESRDGNGMGDDGLKGKMKEAVEKSFGASKDAVKESAESAAKVVEEAVHKTAGKMKENKEPSHDEL